MRNRITRERGTALGTDAATDGRVARRGGRAGPTRTRSKRWSAGTGAWCSACAGASSATPRTRTTPSRPRSWSSSGRPAPSPARSRWPGGCTGSRCGSPARRGPTAPGGTSGRRTIVDVAGPRPARRHPRPPPGPRRGTRPAAREVPPPDRPVRTGGADAGGGGAAARVAEGDGRRAAVARAGTAPPAALAAARARPAAVPRSAVPPDRRRPRRSRSSPRRSPPRPARPGRRAGRSRRDRGCSADRLFLAARPRSRWCPRLARSGRRRPTPAACEPPRRDRPAPGHEPRATAHPHCLQCTAGVIAPSPGSVPARPGSFASFARFYSLSRTRGRPCADTRPDRPAERRAARRPQQPEHRVPGDRPGLRPARRRPRSPTRPW